MKNLMSAKIGDYLGTQNIDTGEVRSDNPVLVCRIRKTSYETWLEGPHTDGMVRSINARTGLPKHQSRSYGSRIIFCLLPEHHDGPVPTLIDGEETSVVSHKTISVSP